MAVIREWELELRYEEIVIINHDEGLATTREPTTEVK